MHQKASESPGGMRVAVWVHLGPGPYMVSAGYAADPLTPPEQLQVRKMAALAGICSCSGEVGGFMHVFTKLARKVCAFCQADVAQNQGSASDPLRPTLLQ
jgi:hypothetical protein